MEIKLQIPDYLSVKQWKQFNSLEHLSETEKMIHMVSILSDLTKEEIMEWKPSVLKQVYSKILDTFSDLNPQFYPVFELDGVLYGFNPISKLTLGEYVDLEKLAEKPQENLEEILAILYRPITKHKFDSIKWIFKNTFKVSLGQAEDLFKYYETEKYNNSERSVNAEKLSVLPAVMGLGALNFFLVLASTSLHATSLSSLPPKQQMKEMKKMNQQIASMNIGDGLQQFIFSRQHPYFQSQEILQYLN